MSIAPELDQTPTRLRTAIDDIAAQVMLNSDLLEDEKINDWVSSLDSLAVLAAQADLRQVSELTTDLVQKLRNADSAPILDSITKLQQVLEQSEKSLQAAQDESLPVVQPASYLSLSSDPELVSEFIMESRDHLSSIETQLLAIEGDSNNNEAVHSIFRSFHTVKGLAGFLDFPQIQVVAHEVETLLDLARNGEMNITPPVVDVILEGADYLKAEIDRVEIKLQAKGDAGDPADNRDLLKRVQDLMRTSSSIPELCEIGEPSAQVESEKLAPIVVVEAPSPLAVPTEVQNGIAVPDSNQIKSVQVSPPVEKKTSGGAEASREGSRFLKVDTSKLDFLVDMVGELVIAQSMLRHDEHLSAAVSQRLQRTLSQLSRITADVQKTAMAMRMVPIGQLFQRSVRLVRDLTRKSGKRVELELSGEDTELDRTLVEDLADPLMHMIRNAADHGVETPEERIAAGKDPLARIALKAYHQAGHIVIELSDDGRGLIRDKILRKAQERRLITDGSQLSDSEVFNLIFEPGFSTAEKITDISGRGVGMDVVRRSVQKLRGRIEIQSVAGKGTTFSIKLPLTLAIIDGLIVVVGSERYVVPIYAVREMFRPSPDKIFTVEGKAEIVLVRGSLLPVVRLHSLFNVVPKSYDAASSLVIVAESGDQRFCLLVDDMLGKQEVVIKSLGESLQRIRGVTGGAILGDGRVGLILDIDAVFGDRSHCANNAC